MSRRARELAKMGLIDAAVVIAVTWCAVGAPVVPQPPTNPSVPRDQDDPRRRIVIGEPPPPGVVDAEDLKPFFDAARVRRVDVIGISDSNQIHHGVGWDQGFNVALAERFSMYATPLVSCAPSNGTQGYLSGALVFPTEIPVQQPVPLVFTNFWNSIPAVTPSGIGNLAAGVSFGPSLAGVAIAANSPIGVTGPLRFTFSYGAYPTPGGGFRPQFRYNGPNSYGGWQQGDWVSSFNPASHEMRTATFDIPAGDRGGNDVYAGYTRPASEPMLGPIFLGLMRAENRDRTVGVSYSTLIYDAGEGLRTMASRLINMPTSQLQYYFTEVTRQQNSPSKMVLVCINSGFNDPNETLSSIGPAQINDSFSGESYADNLLALKNRITQAWVACGYDVSGLYFLVFPSHPPPVFHFAHYLTPYRQAAAQFAAQHPRIASVDFDRLITWEQMAGNNWYYFSTIDTYHLSTAGYEGMSGLLFNALLGPVVAGDVTGDSRVGLEDVAEIVSHWGESTGAWMSGDADGDGIVTLADLARVIDHFGR